LEKSRFAVTGMSCAVCATSVEKILQATDGVSAASVNFADHSVQIEFDSSVIAPLDLKSAVCKGGYDLIVNSSNSVQDQLKDVAKNEYKQSINNTLGATILTTPIIIIGMFFMDWGIGRWISLILTLPVLFVFGRKFYINAWKQLKIKTTNMDTLVALSTSIAFIFSVFNTIYPEYWTNQGIASHVYFEAATVIITFISLGKMLEAKAKSNTSEALKTLIQLQPKEVIIIEDGNEVIKSIEDIIIGDIIRVKPGNRIPVDGILVDGQSYVDESSINGEPIAISKTINDYVYSGSLNQTGSFDIKADKVGSETFLSKVIERVKDAQGSKAPIQKKVDKIAQIFVPTVLIISIITFITWIIMGGESGFSRALMNAVAVLVIACPCALGLATPTAIMVGMGKGAENHILIKDAESLELASEIDTIVLDKTGTITEGKPKVISIWESEAANGLKHWKSIAYSMESKSEHPLATAVVEYLSEQASKRESVTDFSSITGLGIKGINKSQQWFIGNYRWMTENSISLDCLDGKSLNKWKSIGATIIYVGCENELVAMFAISDKIKQSSSEAIRDLMGQGIEVIMLTGDSEISAKHIANEVGINTVVAELSPTGKEDYIIKLQNKGKKVAMVGDGINDSQALARADVSIAMGTGSDIAMDVAQLTLITADLTFIKKAIRLSKRTSKGIRENLFWAFIYNVIGIPVAAGILYPVNGFLLDPMIAGAAMAFSSVSVVLNSLRLKTIKL
ncbi:MAG: heavy metal translocating P-type ATPase, partial [Bacteroidia bacterium]